MKNLLPKLNSICLDRLQVEDYLDLEAAALDLEQAISKIPREGDRGVDRVVGEASNAQYPRGEQGNSNGAEPDLNPRRPGCYSDGLTHGEIHAHSWRPSGAWWVWIFKASAVEGLGTQQVGPTSRGTRGKREGCIVWW